jgi:large subunit ribosomal protein L9
LWGFLIALSIYASIFERQKRSDTTYMKVILKEDVKSLGKKGDIVNVADGYGRNFLIPRGYAVEASKGNLETVKQESIAKQKREAKEKAKAEALAEMLEKITVKVPAKAGEKGRLFGSITAKDISEAVMQQANIEVDRKKIDLADTIKSLGTYKVNVRLYPGISAVLSVNVVEAKLEGEK